MMWFATTQPDLAEGIRAQVIDKDRSPRWQPATIAELSPDAAASALAYRAGDAALGMTGGRSWQTRSRRAARRYSIGIAIDWFFFVFAGLAAIWLAYLSFTETFQVGWWGHRCSRSRSGCCSPTSCCRGCTGS